MWRRIAVLMYFIIFAHFGICCFILGYDFTLAFKDLFGHAGLLFSKLSIQINQCIHYLLVLSRVQLIILIVVGLFLLIVVEALLTSGIINNFFITIFQRYDLYIKDRPKTKWLLRLIFGILLCMLLLLFIILLIKLDIDAKKLEYYRDHSRFK